MAGQDASVPSESRGIDQGPRGRPTIAPFGHDGVDDVLAELEQASAAEAYRAACVDRVLAQIQLAALTARAQILAQIITEAGATLLEAPATGSALSSGLASADAEATRLLTALGVDLTAGGDERGG